MAICLSRFYIIASNFIPGGGVVSKLAKAAYKGTSRAVKAYRPVKRVSKKTYRSTAKRVAAKVYKRPKTVPARSIKSSPRKESRSAAKVIRTTKKAKPKVAKRAQQPRRKTQTRIEKRAGNSNSAGNLDSLDPPKQKSLVKMDLQKFAGNKDAGKYQVGAYKDIKGVEGLDAHHAGQKAVMKKLVNNYNPDTAPAINVPKVGHTIKGPNGIVSRSTKGIENPRQLLARDIMELRRVYDDIPNSALKELIELNKNMYPEMRK
ncbi:hypothetical protein [Bacillus massilinigeriensis]|uniref:hypothetical protein n=1 Tax=Bacillus mediterraneensis TaxID=1805474 RepID=UPI000ACF61DB|nr:hypothetical protein [Bacillus mediterraneensis]